MRKRLVFLCRKTVRDEAKDKVIPSFLKVEEREAFVAVEKGRKRDSQ